MKKFPHSLLLLVIVVILMFDFSCFLVRKFEIQFENFECYEFINKNYNKKD